ncbi:MAG: hypothetical protein ACREK8_11745 [Gemmatimonadales bacterium]
MPRRSAALAAAGTIAWLIGLALQSDRALAAYLFAWAAVVSTIVGIVLQITIGDLARGRWFASMRSHALIAAGSLPALAVLSLPIFLALRRLYPWSLPGVDLHVAAKHAWLNVPFFVIRGVAYLGIWIAVAERLRTLSLRAGAATPGAAAATLALRRVSGWGTILIGLALTFAAFDWFMSTDPAWYSSIYAVYVFAGGFLASFGLIAVSSARSLRGDDAKSVESTWALATMIFTFVIFWAYIAFSQFLIIWIGDLPADASWYVVRVHGGWRAVAFVVLGGQAGLPFLLLLSRRLKRSRQAIGWIGAWLVIMHLADVYWLIMPSLYPAGVAPNWLDLAALLMVAGTMAVVALARAAPVVRLSANSGRD